MSDSSAVAWIAVIMAIFALLCAIAVSGDPAPEGSYDPDPPICQGSPACY